MEPKSNTPIILCGGDINYSHLPIGTSRSNAMIPVNGKPVIGWIFDDLERKGFKDAVVVLPFDNHKLYNYLQWTYSDHFDLHYAYVQPGGSILHSLLAGLSWVMPHKGVYIVLGDTLIADDLPSCSDFLFTGPYDEPENWCLAEADVNGSLSKFYDKMPVRVGDLSALAGGYALSRADILRNIVVRQIQAQGKELSAALENYNEVIPLRIVPAAHWFDFGHIGGFNRAKLTLLQSRYFNSLSIDPVKGTLTKKSEKTEKLQDELNWYHDLPETLKIFTPRILTNPATDGSIEIVQEFYGYPNLAELFVFGDLDLSVWKIALQQLMDVHLQFKTFSCILEKNDLEEMYRHKTFQRLNEMHTQQDWVVLLQADEIILNGETLTNLPALTGEIDQRIESLIQYTTGAVIHGDYCFSNILYDLHSQVVRLIDPRGSFGRKGVFGDPRYDMAKLRHSVSGLYDFIIADFFHLEKLPGINNFTLQVHTPEKQETLSLYLDELMVENGYQLHEIILIEALLFLSMVPYHVGKPKRQFTMYLKGIQLINHLMNYENSDRLGRNYLSHQANTSALQ